MPVYTPKLYIKVLQKRSKELTTKRRQVIFSVASVVHADKGERIFTKGQKDSGAKIGSYSTKPTTINSKQSPVKLKDNVFVPFNQRQRNATGKRGYFGQYFAGGYKQFKSTIGRGSRVNLKLFGDLEKDFNTSLSWNGKTWVEGTKRRNNTIKLESAEDKYGSVFGFTKKERKRAQEIYNKVLLNTMQP